MPCFTVSRASLLLGLALALSGAAHAAKAKTPKAPGAGGNRVTFVPSPSAETEAQRDRRLLRECKGRPNAGACLGYARP